MTMAPFSWDGEATVLTVDREGQDILAEFDAACLDNGALQAMPASFYAGRPQNEISYWCIQRGFYCLPTLELVDFIRDQIDCESAIEIGSGNGALGRAVGIPLTDSRQQERDDIQNLYGTLGQAVIAYGADVEKLTALEAVEKHRPRVVVAAWVTHRYNPQRPLLKGNMNGVDERKLLAKKFVKKYVFVGHERVHELKPILELRHTTHRLPYLYSRAFDQRNVVWVWG